MTASAEGIDFQAGEADEQQFFAHGFLRWAALGIMFITAFAIRAYRISDPPLDFHPTRQYRSAIIARDNYYRVVDSNSVPEWKKQIAAMNRRIEGVLEPPVMEFLTSRAYSIAGGEHLWIPRLLSSVFWLIGAVFLYQIARYLGSIDAAMFSTAFYLFLPYGVSASRSFQPDPLMVMFMLGSVAAIVRFCDQRTPRRLMIAGCFSAMALFVKPVCLFPIFLVFILMHVWKQGIRKSLLSAGFFAFFAVSLLPVAVYYLPGILGQSGLQSQAQKSFIPGLFLDPFFWKAWLTMIERVVGYIPLAGALLGTLMISRGAWKTLIFGLWAGYLSFAAAFNYLIHTHEYYHLQLIPVVALSLGPAGARLVSPSAFSASRLRRASACCVMISAVLFSLRVSRVGILSHQDFQREVRAAEEIGEAVGHSTKTIFLASAYGNPLKYHGNLSGSSWAKRWDLRAHALRGRQIPTTAQLFETVYSKLSPEYFIVTDFEEFNAQPELKQNLFKRFPLLAQNKDYLIFDLRPGQAVRS